MKTLPWIVWTVLLTAAAAENAPLADLGWIERVEDLQRWSPEPTWLGNASPTASLARDRKAACFRVDEPGRGMKWSLSTPVVGLDEGPYLVVRYRAENLNTASDDYLIYLDDRVPGKQLSPVRLCDAKTDGAWHTVAVDLSTLTPADSFSGLAVQVQAAAAGKARLWIEWIALEPSPPAGAEVLQREPAAAPQPDRTIALADAEWAAQPGWLANPAAEGRHHAARQAQAAAFRVADPGRGMKWSATLREPVALEGHRYVSVRYRAQGVRPYGDYALCALGATRDGKSDYRAIVPSEEIVSDGRWHTADVDLRRVAAALPTVTGLAVQVQAEAAGAVLEVADVRLVNARPAAPLADALSWQPGAAWDGFQAVPIAPVASAPSAPWQSHLRISDWFSQAEVTAEGIPFRLITEGNDLAATPLRGRAEVAVPADVSASEIYLLVLAVMTGMEEPAYGQGPLRAIRDVDRFRLRLEYADGSADECLPMNRLTGQFGVCAGPQVLVAAAEPAKRLRAVVLCDLARQAAFAVAAVTARTAGDRLFPAVLEDAPPLRLAPAQGGEAAAIDVPAEGPPRIGRIVRGNPPWSHLAEPSPLVELTIDGTRIPAESLQPMAAPAAPPGQRAYTVRGFEGIELILAVQPQGPGSLSLDARVLNRGPGEHEVALVAPRVGPYRLSERSEDAYYFFPQRGSLFSNDDAVCRERYSGLFPVQFVDTFAPGPGRGLAVRTLDTSCAAKFYRLEKKAGQFTVAIEYPARRLKPGEEYRVAPAVISVTRGDWHAGLAAYRQWVGTWHHLLSPRKPWFREVFNFRQRFLWGLDPLYDARQGKLHLESAVDEACREFGGIDYLHLFDWGNCGPYGRIYGRQGDYSPYDYIAGGRDALRKAIAGVQARGVPVGLYIEGYLLQEKGRLGQEYGKAWQMIGQDGQGRYWPESSEMYVCSYVPAWREVQAATYAAKVEELGVDGMYLDEYGFAGPYVDCWSREHGHPVPGYAVVGERDCTRLVRERIEQVKPGVALYTEETPVDVTTQFQDGSFTYAMSTAQHARTLVPLNAARFALPDFKTIEILYCDKPTGSWATGVKWVFFNGEAIWLEGPAAEWFEPQTREAIRRCHRILRKHRDAFTGLGPEPLVPTEQGGVWANAFSSGDKTVYTLYNARHRTLRGPMLRFPHHPGATYYDEWHERPAEVVMDGPDAVVHVEVGPHDVGCVVVERKGR